MTMLNTAQSWNVGRTNGRCAACGTDLPANTICFAALCDGGSAPKHVEPPPPTPRIAKGKKEEPIALSPFLRVDFCENCWAEGKRPEHLPPPTPSDEMPLLSNKPLDMFSFWKTTVPLPQQKKKLLVDDSVLVDVFSRMEGKAEPQEIRFRFVLALILMRKRLLKYEGMETLPSTSTSDAAAPETWRMIPRGTDQAVQVVNPHLTAEQITEVSQQLSAILAEEV